METAQNPNAGKPVHGSGAPGAGAAPGNGRPSRSMPAMGRWGQQPAAWLLLLVCLLLPAPALLIELEHPGVTSTEEARTLATSLQTWQSLRDQQIGFTLAPSKLVPIHNSQPELYRPPGMVWTHLLAFNLHDPLRSTFPPDRAAHIGRMISVMFALLAVVGAFWAGRCLGDNRTAALAGLGCASFPLLVLCGRLAGAPMAHAGLSMISVAAALWAIRPLKPAPTLTRQALGWLLCGLALGAAFLIVGPIALLTIALPILLLLILCPGRLSHLLGLLAALLIGFVIVLPWTIYLHEQNPEAWRQWLGNMLALPADGWGGLLDLISHRSRWLLVALMPWPLWLLGALVQPFSHSSRGTRQKMFLGWAWFVALALTLIFLPGAGGFDALLPLLPAAAVLLAQLFTQYMDLAGAGRFARFWRRLRWAHAVMLLVLSVLIPIFIHTPPTGLAEFIAPMSWIFAIGLGIALLAILFLSLKWMIQDYPGRTFLAWSIWAAVAMTLLCFPLVRSPLAHTTARADGRAIAALTHGQPVFWLDVHSDPQRPDIASDRPDPALEFYAGGPMPTLEEHRLHEALERQETLFLIAPSDAVNRLNLPAIARLPLPHQQRVLYACTLPPQPDSPATQPQTMPAILRRRAPGKE